jgi:hypothetical protein
MICENCDQDNVSARPRRDYRSKNEAKHKNGAVLCSVCYARLLLRELSKIDPTFNPEAFLNLPHIEDPPDDQDD